MTKRRIVSLADAVLAFAVLATPTVASATNYRVGPSETERSFCALANRVRSFNAGDVIEVLPGTYREACQVRGIGTATSPIILRGAAGGARPVFSGEGMDLTGAGSVPRAIFQFMDADYWIVENLELTTSRNSNDNGGGVRVSTNARNITLRNLEIHLCDMGVFQDAGTSLVVESCDVHDNGSPTEFGFSHNFYLNGWVRLIGNHIHDSRSGQNVKIRGHYAELLYNWIENAANYEIDLIQSPEATTPSSHVVMVGNVVIRNIDADNDSQTILWGTDNRGEMSRNGNLYAYFNTFVLRNSRNVLFVGVNPRSTTAMTFSNNVVVATAAGASFTDVNLTGLFGGTNNWFGDGFTLPAGLAGSVRGADPMFTTSYTNLRPTRGSPLVDAASTGALSYVDESGTARSIATLLEHVRPTGYAARSASGARDIGAFEATAPSPLDAGVYDGSIRGDASNDAMNNDGSVADATITDATTRDTDGDAVIPDATADAGLLPLGGSGCGCRIARSVGNAESERAISAGALASIALLLGFRGRRRRSNER